MGMSEGFDERFGDVTPLPSEFEKKKFEEANALAKKIHFGDMDDLLAG